MRWSAGQRRCTGAGGVQRLAADIVLLDLSMKHTGGLDALPAQFAASAYPASKVLILSMHTDPELIMRTPRWSPAPMATCSRTPPPTNWSTPCCPAQQ